MSAIYNLEPQPTGSVILHTTLGEISVELFAKQTPLTCRNFLQHALDGYYDGTVFHRLVPGFIVQGGDPTGTGHGGESIYDGGAFSGDLDPWPMDMRQGRNAGPQGVNFRDEMHSRLKFNRRGLMGMANDGRADSNGSQFFLTLDKTEELNGRNTLFGRVAGDTIYNLAKIGEAEVAEGTDRPLYPIRVDRVEVLVNPFEDMKKRERVAAPAPAPADKKKKKAGANKRKGGKQLLSFGDDEGEEEEVPVPKKAKFDTRIIADEPEEEQEAAAPKPKKKKPKKAVEEKPAVEEEKPAPAETKLAERPTKRPSPSPSPEPQKQKTALELANEEMAAIKASLRRTVHTPADDGRTERRGKSALEAMIPQSSVKGARRRRPGQTAAEDPKTLRMLQAFQSKLGGGQHTTTTSSTSDKAASSARTEGKGAAPAEEDGEAALCDLHFIANCQSCTAWDKQDGQEDGEDEDDGDWMSHALSFAADRLGKDLTNRRKAEEELVVIDPREKARALKEDGRRNREREGGKAWDQRRDQARNAKLAQASSLAGRGAK